ncbi:MAG: TOBE domain-containing protein [Actinobacteria bacterium]|nr:TOBE domain-containing protein [Actinomycetota bacterium]
MNLWPAVLVRDGVAPSYRVGDATLTVRSTDGTPMLDVALVGIRPERVAVQTEGGRDETEHSFAGEVRSVTFRGDADLMEIQVPALGEIVTAQCPTGRWTPGTRVSVGWAVRDLIVVPVEAGAPSRLPQEEEVVVPR